ncbi:hypothetical protein KIPB_010844, partial [Kipferlia bialata]
VSRYCDASDEIRRLEDSLNDKTLRLAHSEKEVGTLRRMMHRQEKGLENTAQILQAPEKLYKQALVDAKMWQQRAQEAQAEVKGQNRMVRAQQIELSTLAKRLRSYSSVVSRLESTVNERLNASLSGTVSLFNGGTGGVGNRVEGDGTRKQREKLSRLNASVGAVGRTGKSMIATGTRQPKKAGRKNRSKSRLDDSGVVDSLLRSPVMPDTPLLGADSTVKAPSKRDMRNTTRDPFDEYDTPEQDEEAEAAQVGV